MPKRYIVKTTHIPIKGGFLLPWGIFGGFLLLLILYPDFPWYSLLVLLGSSVLAGLAVEIKSMKKVFILSQFGMIFTMLILFFLAANGKIKEFSGGAFLVVIIYTLMNLFLFSISKKSYRG